MKKIWNNFKAFYNDIYGMLIVVSWAIFIICLIIKLFGGTLVKGNYYGGFNFSRIYSEQGDEGWWQQQYFAVNEQIEGTAYYRIVR